MTCQWIAVVLAAALVESLVGTSYLRTGAFVVAFLFSIGAWVVEMSLRPEGTAVVVQARVNGFHNRTFNESKEFAKKKFQYAYPLAVNLDSDPSTWSPLIDKLNVGVELFFDETQGGAVDPTRMAVFVNAPVAVSFALGNTLGDPRLAALDVWGPDPSSTERFSFKLGRPSSEVSELLTNTPRVQVGGAAARCLVVVTDGRQHTVTGELAIDFSSLLVLTRPKMFHESQFEKFAAEVSARLLDFLAEDSTPIFFGSDLPVEVALRVGQKCASSRHRIVPLHFRDGTYSPISASWLPTAASWPLKPNPITGP